MEEEPEWLETALGYIELKMFAEAWEALNELPLSKQNSLEALAMRVTCRLDEELYQEAFDWCEKIRDQYSDEHVAYIQGAFCLHSLNQTKEARAWLQSGPYSLQSEGVYFYNLACYDLALGLEESACSWLLQAFEMEPDYHEDALQDPDLKKILPRVQEMRQENEDGFIS